MDSVAETLLLSCTVESDNPSLGGISPAFSDPMLWLGRVSCVQRNWVE